MDTAANPAKRVRERMQQWLDLTKLGQREFAKAMQKSQIWLQKVLSGENHVRLKDLDIVAAAMRTTAADLVRTEDRRYLIECTPAEFAVLERLRMRRESFEAVRMLLDVPLEPVIRRSEAPPSDEHRTRAKPFNPKAGRPNVKS